MNRSSVSIVPELLESRRLCSSTADNVLILGTTANDHITLQVNQIGSTRQVIWSVNGNAHIATGSSYTKVTVVDPGGHDTFEVLQTASSVNIDITAGSGNDTLKLPFGDYIRKGITFNGGSGDDRIEVKHSGNAGGQALSFDSDRLSWNSTRFVVGKETERFEITGSKSSDTIDIGLVRESQRVTFNGDDGADTFNVGRGKFEKNVIGRLTVNGNGGSDTVFFDDRDDSAPDNYKFDLDQFSKPGVSKYTTGFSAETVRLDCNNSRNRIEVPRLVTQTLVVNGRGGDDTLQIGRGEFAKLQLVAAKNIQFNGGDHNNYLAVNDYGSWSPSTFTVDRTTIRKGSTHTFGFSQIMGLLITAGQNNDVIDATRTNLPVELEGNGGDDRLLGGSANDYLAGGNGKDYLRGNNGNDKLVGGAGADDLNGNNGDDELFEEYAPFD